MVNGPEEVGEDENWSAGGGQGLSSIGNKAKRQECIGMQSSSEVLALIFADRLHSSEIPAQD